MKSCNFSNGKIQIVKDKYMAQIFDYLKEYVEENEYQSSNKKHVFYKVSKEDIRKALQSKDQFVKGISYELRNT